MQSDNSTQFHRGDHQVVILAHSGDTSAAAIAARVSAALGPKAVTVLRPEQLGLATWSHRVISTGGATTELRWASGRHLRSSQIACLLNRMAYVPTPRFSKAPRKDREYADAELQALVVSWLAGLGTAAINPVNSRAQARGTLSGRGWLALAAAQGLPVATFSLATAGRMIAKPPAGIVRLKQYWPGGFNGPMPAEAGLHLAMMDSGDAILVTGDQACGSLAGEFGERCVAVARCAGCSLLEFRFSRVARQTVLCTIDPLPPLSEPWALDAVARLLVCMRRRGGES
jgi:hypothetical protein